MIKFIDNIRLLKFIAEVMGWLCWINVLLGQSASFQTYMNPVIPGDHPDCTLSRIGNDFYTTGSSFNVTPVIYHSTDLVHWEAIAQPVSAAWTNYGDSPGGGCWGGQMVYYNGEYWHFFSRANTMHFVKAPDPKGPWSMPVKINNPATLPYGLGYDNSVFIDDDNKWYLVVKNGKPNNGIVELGNDGQPTGVVYDLNWLNPDPSYPYGWAEGPVIWKYNGYYYYSFARDLGGGQKVMRSQTLTAEQSAWEMLGDFFNESDPLKYTSLFTSPNHASAAILLDDSTAWVVHPLYARSEWKGQGRQGLLNQVRYDADNRPVADYPINSPFTAPNLPDSGIPWMVPHSDFFTSAELHPEWSFLGYTPQDKYSLTDRPGWLLLTPKNRAAANTVIKNDGEHNYTLITRLDFSAQSTADEAGLWIMRGDQTMAVKLVSTLSATNQKIVAFSYQGTKYETENGIGDTLWLKLIRINHLIGGYYSADGIDWTALGEAFDISEIDSYSDFSTFTGTRQGLYVRGANPAWFDFYIYRDAYTPILAECPANQYGMSLSRRTDGIASLDMIHNNDWALYAGVEFGNTEYHKSPDSLEFTASCGSSGGIIEVWLDSLDSGNKIAECNITSTGSWTNFRRFVTNVTTPVTGNHDIYLQFKGTDTEKLFMLKWLTFIDCQPDTSVGTIEPDRLPGEFKLHQNFPNPFNPTTMIQYSVPVKGFVSLKVFDLAGKEVMTLCEGNFPAGHYTATFDGSELSSGLYFYVLHAGNAVRSKKMILIK